MARDVDPELVVLTEDRLGPGGFPQSLVVVCQSPAYRSIRMAEFGSELKKPEYHAMLCAFPDVTGDVPTHTEEQST